MWKAFPRQLLQPDTSALLTSRIVPLAPQGVLVADDQIRQTHTQAQAQAQAQAKAQAQAQIQTQTQTQTQKATAGREAQTTAKDSGDSLSFCWDPLADTSRQRILKEDRGQVWRSGWELGFGGFGGLGLV